jgi:RNA polymerase sigma-70 factor, ECF subfamily
MESLTVSEDPQNRFAGMPASVKTGAPMPALPSRVSAGRIRVRVQMACTRHAPNGQETKKRVAELPRVGGEFDFDRIYRTYSRSVFTQCLRMVRDRSEAEDLTQDAFMQLFRKLHTFRGESAFRTWMFRLVTNVALMHLRKKNRMMMRETPLEEDYGVREDHDPLRRDLGAPDQSLAGANDRVILERAIRKLAPGYQRVFLLHDREGYIHSEISTILGLGIGTSKSQLHKARRHLRRLLRSAR